MKKRILITSTSAGTGHVAAATALEKAFHSDNRVAEVRHEDALNFTNKLFRDFYSKLYELYLLDFRLLKETPANLLSARGISRDRTVAAE